SSAVKPVVVVVEGEPGRRRAVVPTLESLDTGTDRVVSIRLDSDDILLPGVVEKVARAASLLPVGSIIDLYEGYQYDVTTRRMTTFARGVQGPFLGIVHGTGDDMLDAGE